MGPVLFTTTGLNVPFSSLLGSFSGSLIGFSVVGVYLLSGRRRRDRELQLAANSALREAGLFPNVRAAVKNSRALLTGEIDQYAQRHLAARVLSGVPGIAGVTNHLHLRFTGRKLNPEEIQRKMADSFLQHAELDADQIQVRVQESNIVLEGTVHSSADASEAEELAWDVEGIEGVKNRLKIAA